MSKLSGHQDRGWQTGVWREGDAWRLDSMFLIGMIMFPCFSSTRGRVWHPQCPMTGIEIHKLYVCAHNLDGRGVLMSIHLCLGTRLLPCYFHYYQIVQISDQVFSSSPTWQDSEIMRMQTNPKQLMHIQISSCCPQVSAVSPTSCQRGGCSSFTPLECTLLKPDQPLEIVFP